MPHQPWSEDAVQICDICQAPISGRAVPHRGEPVHKDCAPEAM